MCTLEKRGNVYILTLTGTDDHRLNPTLIDSISAAFRCIRSEATSAAALVTTAEGKFFSNGFDLRWAQSDKHRILLMTSKLRSLLVELMSLPMPTIAAVSGHACAAGLMLALSHDYVLMRKDRGLLYLSELDIGLTIPNWFVSILKAKVKSPAALRDAILRAEKMAAKAAVEKGIIDAAYDSTEETVTAAVELGEDLVGRKWNGQVYAENRKILLSDLLHELVNTVKTEESLNNSGLLTNKVESRL